MPKIPDSDLYFQAADTTESLVPILYEKLRCAQSAADEIVTSVRGTVKDFDAAAQRLLQRFAKDPDVDNSALQNFIDGCRYYCTGNLAWRYV